MAGPGPDLPEWAKSLRNIAELEAKNGFNNNAVIGGMDRFRQRWQSPMEAWARQLDEAPLLLRRSYSEMGVDERKEWVKRWLSALSEHQGHRADYTVLEDAPAISTTLRGEEEEGFTATRASEESRPIFRLPPAGQSVDAPVTQLKGVSDRTATRLRRLDVATVRDLLYLFPRRHEDYSNVVSISEIVPGEDCTVIATVWESRVITQGPKGRRHDTEATLSDDTGTVRAIWFGQRYIARTLPPGRKVAISGKAEEFRGQLSFESPAVEPVEFSYSRIHTGRMVPVYPLTEGISARAMRGFTWEALQNWLGGVDETLPESTTGPDAHVGRMPLREAIFQAHYPADEEAWQVARSRLAFDELLTLQLAVLSRRRETQAEVRGVPITPPDGVVERFLDSLPFDLTKAQARSIGEIAKDMRRGAPPMNRLLQGEVGSGKTVVALAALLSAASAGFQGALMAPTEVLAEQHFRSTSRLLEGIPRQMEEDNLIAVHLEGLQRPVSVGLLTGSVRASVKRLLTSMAADGTLHLVIGTQALIQEGVSIPGLALAVADEQHRFGVMQRSALRQRGRREPPYPDYVRNPHPPNAVADALRGPGHFHPR